MKTAQPTIESLLVHQAWLAALAQKLVADPARADDLAQEAWLEALSNPPRHAGNPRGWLASILRNKARDHGRVEASRRRRETENARREAVEQDAATVAERATLQRRLVDEVLALDEPYKTVVLLRFFDGRKPGQIARDLGRPVETVRTQIQRGLDRMRKSLDREYGDRATWVFAFAPLLVRTGRSTLAAVTGWLGAAAVVGLLGWGGYELIGDDTGAQPDRATVTLQGDVKGAPETEAASGSERQRVPDRAPGPADVTPVPAGPQFRGRVVDLRGRPLADLAIEFLDPDAPRFDGRLLILDRSTSMEIDDATRRTLSDARIARLQFGRRGDRIAKLMRGEKVPAPSARTDAEGRFALRGPKNPRELSFADGNRRLIRPNSWRKDADRTHWVLVVAETAHVHGTVRDEAGNPIAGADVSTSFSLDSLPALREAFAGQTAFLSQSDTTNELGRFDLGRIPMIDSIFVRASKRGYEATRLETTNCDDRSRSWTLRRRPASARRTISGIVLLPDGSPAEKAYVRFGSTGASADGQGRFSFELGRTSSRYPLTVTKKGHQAAVLQELGKRLRDDPKAGQDLALRLGPAPKTIRGKLVDSEGKPLAGYRIVLADGVPFGTYTGITIESYITEGFKQTKKVTGADGSFEFGGLNDRDYHVRAWRAETLHIVNSGPIRAGQLDAVVRAPEPDLFEVLRGVVVGRDGRPIPDVELGLSAPVIEQHGSSILARGKDRVRTDADGRFVLRSVPRHGVTLDIHSEGFVYRKIPVTTADLRVELARELRFCLRVFARDLADRYEIHDANGTRLNVTQHYPTVITSWYRCRIDAPEKAPECTVSDAATTLVLFKNKSIVRKIPLQLRVEGVTKIDL